MAAQLLRHPPGPLRARPGVTAGICLAALAAAGGCASRPTDEAALSEAREVEVENGQTRFAGRGEADSRGSPESGKADPEPLFTPVDLSHLGREPDISEIEVFAVPPRSIEQGEAGEAGK